MMAAGKRFTREEINRIVIRLIANMLKIPLEEIHPQCSFFYLGGDSLKLLYFVQEIESIFQMRLDTRLLLKHNRITDIVKLILFLKRHSKLQKTNFKSTTRQTRTLFTFEQQQIWLAHHASKNKAIYNVPWVVEIKGNLDEEKLITALEKFVIAQPLLNCSIDQNKETPSVVFHPYTPFRFEKIESKDKEVLSVLENFIAIPFDLSIGPLYCFRFFKTETRYLLCGVFHHLIVDAESLNHLTQTLSMLYNRPDQEVQYSFCYSDYLEYQDTILGKPVTHTAKCYWNKEFYSSEAVINFPKMNKFLNDDHKINKKCALQFNLDKGLLSKAKEFSKRSEVTLFTVFFSIFSVVIHRLVHQVECYISLPVSTRLHSSFLNTFGLFIQLLPFKLTFNPNIEFSNFLKKIAVKLFHLYRYGYLPHSTLKALKNLSPEVFYSMFNVAFSMDYEKTLNLDDLKTTILSVPYVGYKFDLTFFIKIQEEGSACVLIEFDPNRFSEIQIHSLFQAFCCVTKQVIENPFLPIKAIPLVRRTQNVTRVDAVTATYPTILHRFLNIVKQYPKNVAIDYQAERLTFDALNRLSNQFAHYLKSRGVKEGDRLAILMEHSVHLIVCILGILKARCAYVPIHPDTPEERIQYIIEQSHAKTLVIDLKKDSSVVYSDTLIMETFLANQDLYSNAWSLNNLPEDLAYIIFTSGSTGKPKGVMINHQNLSYLFAQTDRVFEFNNQDKWLLFHSYAFDFSVWEILGALLHGATLVIPETKNIQSPESIFHFIVDRNITILNQTPSAFYLFSNAAIKKVHHIKLPLRYLFFGGEAINAATLLKWFRYFPSNQPKLINLYGITEGTVHVTYQFLNQEIILNNLWGTPIGTPLPGNTVYLFDQYQHAVPLGFMGEIYFSGKGVAQGYVNDKTHSLERFIDFKNKRLYKTGDLAIQNEDNTFSYFARKDKQVKIRGYRIELEEIETALMKLDEIDYAIVTVDDEDELNKTLNAFIVLNDKKTSYLAQWVQLRNDNKYHLTELPHHRIVVDKNLSETKSLYQEIFIDKQYSQAGIQLHNALVVIDVGANIGLFSLFVKQMNPKASIYAYEPFENLCACLEKNKILHHIDMVVHPIGLSNQKGTKRFAYFEKVTAMSTYAETESASRSLLSASIPFDDQIAIEALVEDKLQAQYVHRPVDTLSNQIKQHGLTCIDLLKIDAEGAELDILQGIEPQHWQFIQQIVVEVHPIKNRLTIILELLDHQGFFVTYEKSARFSNAELYMIYATKRKKSLRLVDGDPPIAAMPCEADLVTQIKQQLSQRLPSYMLPSHYHFVTEIPTTLNGKTDYQRLKILSDKKISLNETFYQWNDNHCLNVIKNAWEEVLGQRIVDWNLHFFEAGGTSLLAIELAEILSRLLRSPITVIDIFNYPTIQKFSDYFFQKILKKDKIINKQNNKKSACQEIAIVAMNGLFPKAKTIDDFWQLLMSKKSGLSHFKDSLYQPNDQENFISIAGVIDKSYYFDAEHFKIPASEALLLDPQQRLLLELCYLNLKNAKVNLTDQHNVVGIFASADISQYSSLLKRPETTWQRKQKIDYNNVQDFLATRIAYKLGLTGPAITVNTACSSALSACVQAANSLLRYECDTAIICAASLLLPEVLPGYYYEPDGILSENGRCCPFDRAATGTVPGSAAASIVLKRVEDAQENKDTVIALLHDYSINNDGSNKVGYTAPSVAGQKKCLEKIYHRFTHEIDYIETHGTGTKIGDAVEIQALSEIFHSRQKSKINLGAVKANIGHTGAASGLCGLIKTALILNKRIIPPQRHFKQWNDYCCQADQDFFINTTPKVLDSGIRYAGVSAFGIGGTNVHLLLRSTESKKIYHEQYDLTLFKKRECFSYLSSNKITLKEDSVSPTFKSIANLDSIDLNRVKHLDLIKSFLKLIADEFGIKNNLLKLDDNFFDLGGDSLMALSVLSKIHKKYKVRISLDDIYQSKNLRDILLSVFKGGNNNQPKCNLLQTGGDRNLVLIHTGGGYVYEYDFFKELGLNDVNIMTIENQVLNDIGSKISSIKTMAEQYIRLLDKKIINSSLILGGWSFGGSVAYEMAYQLQQAGCCTPKVVLFDSWANYPKKYMDFDQFKSIWFKRLDLAYHFEDDQWITMLWHRLKMLITHQPLKSKLDVTLYKALEVEPDFVTQDDPSNFWESCTKHLTVITVKSRHQNILSVMRKKNLFYGFLEK